MIIDCHGHYTTAPPALATFRNNQLAGLADTSLKAMDLEVSDDEYREGIERAQLKLSSERGGDLTIFSPRAGGMAHHVGTEAVSKQWTTHLQRPHPPHLQSAAG